MRYFVLGGVTDSDSTTDDINDRLERSCKKLGQVLCDSGHSLIICSPFQDSADYWTFNLDSRNS